MSLSRKAWVAVILSIQSKVNNKYKGTHLGSGNPKRKRLRITHYPKWTNINKCDECDTERGIAEDRSESSILGRCDM